MESKIEPPVSNTIESDPEKGRIRAEAEKSDADAHAWVERKKLMRAKMATKPPVVVIPEPEQVLASSIQAQSTESKNADSIERDDAFSSPSQNYKLVPPEIRKKYLLLGNKYHNQDASKTVAFIDRGDKLQTSSSSPQIAEDLVKIADARGWEELRVRGTDTFKREVWLEASVRGIHVAGYKPSELDKAELERRSTFIREENSVEVRSNAFSKLSPSEGVRKDPSLANAYATVAAAKVFAREKIADGSSRQSFVESVTQSVTNKIEANQPITTVQLRVPEGTLIEHGSAPYNFNQEEKNSYYVRLADRGGKERVLWGVGLRKALADVSAQPGDKIRLKVAEAKDVTVEANIRDANNQVIGQKVMDSHRNEWQAEVVSRDQAQTRAQGQDRGRSA